MCFITSSTQHCSKHWCVMAEMIVCCKWDFHYYRRQIRLFWKVFAAWLCKVFFNNCNNRYTGFGFFAERNDSMRGLSIFRGKVWNFLYHLWCFILETDLATASLTVLTTWVLQTADTFFLMRDQTSVLSISEIKECQQNVWNWAAPQVLALQVYSSCFQCLSVPNLK